MVLTQSGLYQFRENSTTFTVTFSHPTLFATELQVAVNRQGKGEGCSNLAGGTQVSVMLGSKELLGKSYSVTCTKQQKNGIREGGIRREAAAE